jgi:hypothetical protein
VEVLEAAWRRKRHGEKNGAEARHEKLKAAASASGAQHASK